MAGVWHIRIGTPEQFVPTRIREKQPDTEGLKKLPSTA